MTRRGVRKSQWVYLGLVLNRSFDYAQDYETGVRKSQRERLGLVLNRSFDYAQDDEMGRSAQVPAGVPGAVAV